MSDRSLIRNVCSVTALTMASRVLGLVRDKALVLVFGASAGVLDAFLLAFTIPNLFRQLFGEGALSNAFIPVFVSTRENESHEKANRLASLITTAMCLGLGILTVLGSGACLLAGMLAGPENALALDLTAAMLPFMLFVCLAAVGSGMLQSVRSFSLPAAMPIILNAAMLAALAYVGYFLPTESREEAIYWVAFSVLASGLLQIMVQYPALHKAGITIKLAWDWANPAFKQVLAALGPAVLGLAVFQINVLCDRLIAYLLIPGDGALTHLYLANRIMQLPLGLFSVAVATTVFPEFASYISRKEWQPFLGKFTLSLRFLLFVMLPAAVGTAATAEPVIRMIFQEPNLAFSHEAVYRTSLTLACFAPSLAFIPVQMLLTRVFYASGEYRTPVRITSLMVGVNLMLNLVFIYLPDPYLYFVHGQKAALAEGGLALATSVSSLLNVIFLRRALCARMKPQVPAGIWQKAFEPMAGSLFWMTLAAIASGVFAYLVGRSIQAEPELLVRIERGMAAVILGAGGYAVACIILAVPELEEFFSRKKKPAAQTQSEGAAGEKPADKEKGKS